MGSKTHHEPLTIERLERALVLLAYMIELDGDVHVPAYERLENELQSLKRTTGTMERARQRLEANRHRLVDLELKAKGK